VPISDFPQCGRADRCGELGFVGQTAGAGRAGAVGVGAVRAEACPEFQRSRAPAVPCSERRELASAMHLYSYRDEDRSRHLDLIGGPGHPWSIDLVAAIASVCYWWASAVP